MRRIFAVIATLALALATLAGVARTTAPDASAGALSHSCELRVWVNNVPTGPRFAVSPAQYPELCGAEPTATPTRTATPVPPTATVVPPTNTPVPPTPTPTPGPGGVGACGEDFEHWHGPLVGTCQAGHEHGDAPPAWVNASAWMPMFTHPGNTPTENQLKHTGFKAFLMRDDGVDVYAIMHLDTNPNGHTSRFHSVQVWARDATGAVSHWDHWVDFGEGNNTEGNVLPVDSCPGGNGGVRPIIAVNYQSCSAIQFESWYSRAGAVEWGWDFGYNVKPQYYAGPTPGTRTNGDLANVANWLPTGDLNDVRRMEAAWYSGREHPTGTFYATQWGELVSGPTAAVCGTPRTFGTKTYTTLCIQQHIAASMTQVSFDNNSIQREYDTTGVTLPN